MDTRTPLRARLRPGSHYFPLLRITVETSTVCCAASLLNAATASLAKALRQVRLIAREYGALSKMPVPGSPRIAHFGFPPQSHLSMHPDGRVVMPCQRLRTPCWACSAPVAPSLARSSMAALSATHSREAPVHAWETASDCSIHRSRPSDQQDPLRGAWFTLPFPAIVACYSLTAIY